MPVARLMLPSSIQNVHSGSGTKISALANTLSPSLVLMPSMWSGWKCEMRMVSISLRLTPAAARLAFMKPALSVIWPAVPVSISTSLAPVFTSSAVKEIGSTPGGRKAAASASFDRRAAGIADELVVDRQIPDAVVKRSELVVAELVAIDAGALRAGHGRGGARAHRQRGGACGEHGAGQERTAGKSGHGVSSSRAQGISLRAGLSSNTAGRAPISSIRRKAL